VILSRKCATKFVVIVIAIHLFNIDNTVVASAFIDIANMPSNEWYNKRHIISVDKDNQLARSHRERRGRRGNKRRKQMNTANQGSQRTGKSCSVCKMIKGFVPMSEISDAVRIMVGKSWIVEKSEAVEIQKSRGAIETGLVPVFLESANCPEIDSEKWAIDYSHKRPWPAIHKGIDIPQPHGTPILAVAAGTVVGKFKNRRNRKGIEVMIRHTPEQTGLSYWTYSQYTHLLEMSPLTIGQSVKIGEEVGKTSNSGKMGRRIRRDALHFAILYSKHPEWSNDGRFVTPKGGYWMDPNAFYRLSPPFDSKSIKRLPKEDKKVSVSYMKFDGSLVPPNTKRIWPYPCD